MDFAAALLIFTFTLVVYFSYTNNFQKQEKGDLDSVIADAKAMSSSLVLSGYPAGWDNNTVIRIGIADEQKVNATKIKYFKQLNYSRSKMHFATIYDYFVFFIDKNDNVLNINGICGVGSPLINVTYKIRSAYYYQDPADSFLKDFMNITFDADVYFNDEGSDIYGLYGFISNLSKYGLIVMEHPDISPSDFDNFKSKVENFSSSGGLTMVSGQLTSAQGRNLVGVDFFKKSGQSESDRNSTVNNTDPYLSLSVGQNIVFRQAYYVENTSNSFGFKQIATFNADGRNALSRWQYGNGTVYFFSDFDVSYFDGDFVGLVKDATKSFVQGTCTQINTTSINKFKLAKTERYLNYNSKVVKMVVYLWQ